MVGSPIPTLEHTYAATVPALSLAWAADVAPEPALVALNEPLADELGFDVAWLRSPDGIAFLSGRAPEGVTTVAQAYAGHQFGGYSPRLGDGRAVLLGEVVDRDGRRRDLHLKGSGATPFSRGADGKAALGPMLREFLVSEGMHGLGIPTSRSLAVVTTGERVFRDDGPQQGAILCRVASSHLRVGTFQYAATLRDKAPLHALVDYAVERHAPDAAGAERPALALLEHVCRAQASLIAQWMLVGFVHGVMNTDNTTISGETIDYGPCAFIEAYDPRAVFSSIDVGGRYAYGNQPAVAQWNLARLGETLIPLIDDDRETAVAAATEAIIGFGRDYTEAFRTGLAAKLGLAQPHDDLQGDLLELLESARIDVTAFFRDLADGTARARFEGAGPDAAGRFDAWQSRREALLTGDDAATGDDAETGRAMRRVNPAVIPRNHRVEEALAAANAGDLAPFERLTEALARPFDDAPEFADLREPGPTDAPPFVTYCGT